MAELIDGGLADVQKRPRKRQQRGERRIESLLQAAEALFGEIGYERATTNLIARRASASPGTLYQFFPDKQAMAEALAKRYVTELRELCDQALSIDRANGPLHMLVDSIVDSFFSFHVKRPAFYNLLLASTISADLRESLYGFLDIVAGRLTLLSQARTPHVPVNTLQLISKVCVSIWDSLVPLSFQADDEDERALIIKELKTVLERYLEPVLGA